MTGPLALLGLAASQALSPGYADAGVFQFRDEAILGTRLNLILMAPSEAIARTAALAARAEIDRLDGVLNSRRPGGELVALNRAGAFHASPDLFAVVQAAEAWRQRTAGAYSGRLGRVIDLWRGADGAPPDRAEAARLAQAANQAEVGLDPARRLIHRPSAVEFALDGLAKGYIVDRALAAARVACPELTGGLVDIGGDIRCWGEAPWPSGWAVDLPDPIRPADNAPAAAMLDLRDQAIATSGRGPRDRLIGGQRYSPTLSPFDGWSVERALSASVIAPSAADADALATALMVAPQNAQQWAQGEVGARLTLASGQVQIAGLWRGAGPAAELIPAANAPAARPGQWPAGWQALTTFTAPRRQLLRDPDFRSPYVAIWVTDTKNRLVRTLILVGKKPDWQKDNFIWWSSNRAQALKMISVRSMGTSGAGIYNVFWDGVDDAGKPVAAGTYVIHVETSRERGKHTYRSITVDFSQPRRFNQALPSTEEGGGLKVNFDRY